MSNSSSFDVYHCVVQACVVCMLLVLALELTTLQHAAVGVCLVILFTDAMIQVCIHIYATCMHFFYVLFNAILMCCLDVLFS
jgi:hypothetical protein